MKTPINHALSLNYPERCGFKDLPEDTFADVRRALDAWLLKNDANYRRVSETQRARAIAFFERRKKESELFALQEAEMRTL